MTLSVNALPQLPNKKIQASRLYLKMNPSLCCTQETYLNIKDNHRFRLREWKNIFQANVSKKQPGKK